MYNTTIGTDNLTIEAVLELYANVGWTKYTENPENLLIGITNSTYVVTIREGTKILGLARCISDDVSINYLQDILVHTDFQRKGIGRKLLERCLDRFKHVRTHILLTDDKELQRKFFESHGYKNTKDLKKITLNCFAKMTDMVLQ